LVYLKTETFLILYCLLFLQILAETLAFEICKVIALLGEIKTSKLYHDAPILSLVVVFQFGRIAK